MQRANAVVLWQFAISCWFVIIAISLGKTTIPCERGSYVAINKSCIDCPKHCNACNSNTCFVCENGYKGNLCEEKCLNCQHGTVCDKVSGYCNTSCSNGLFGNLCDEKCDSKCMSCDRLNPSNCIACALNRHGYKCDEECSRGCLNNTCNYNDSECSHGCSANYYGKSCKQQCSLHCINNVCDNITGECLFGCIDGYNGTHCSFSTHHTHYDSVFQVNALEIGVFVGLAIVVIAAFVLLYVCIKKKKNRRFSDDNESYAVIQISSLNNDNRPDASAPVLTLSTISRKKDITNRTLQVVIHTDTRIAIAQQANQVLEINLEDTHATEDPHEADIHSIGVGDEEAYYNTSALKKKIAIEKLADYIKQKTTSELADEFKELPRGLIKPYTESQKEENIRKNRYRGFYPYDQTRVIIKDGDSDFINASYIDGYNRLRAYIASLGPTKEFMGDISVFWRMVWQENCGKIVMLTNLQESQVCKCDKYWPDKGLSDLYSDFIVSCHKEWKRKHYIMRFFSIQWNTEKREIVQFHFTAWPDKGVPADVQNLLTFRQEVNDFNTDLDGPVLVHCSAGVGRTGTYIALDILTKEGEAEGGIDIFACVRYLREQRVKMVQTVEQYEFLHHALVYSLNSQPVYATCIKERTKPACALSEADNM